MDQRSEHYKYSAFISYRHVDLDRRWAKWLLENLETYKTPRSLVKEGKPVCIGKIFRDDDEIPASSDLSSQIVEALKDSEYLIVVCSPNTPHSKWVRQEIATFQKLGRSNKILAFLVDGEPADSFPKELRFRPGSDIEIEPIAADVRPRSDEPKSKTENRALIRIAATLLRCSFDDLLQREQKRALRRKRIISTAVAASLFIALSSYVVHWDYNRAKAAYYVDYRTHYAEPFGIIQLSKAEAKRRATTYKLVSRRNKVSEIHRINGSGSLDSPVVNGFNNERWLDDIAKWIFVYDGDGYVLKETLADRYDNILVTLNYKFNNNHNEAIVDFRSMERARAMPANLSAFSYKADTSDKSTISQHKLVFDQNGLLVERGFETAWGEQATDMLGNIGRTYRYNQAGQVSSIKNTSKPTIMRLKPVVHELTKEYDERGNIVKIAFFDDEGKPISTDKGHAYVLQEYNTDGNMTQESSFNIFNQVTLNDFGYAIERNEYDSSGNRTKISNFDIFDRPTYNILGTATVKRLFDKNGNVIETVSYDIHDKIAVDKLGQAITRMKFNDDNRVMEKTEYDANEKPMADKTGAWRTTWKYDDQRVSEVAWFDIKGNLAISSVKGYAKEKSVYDSKGNIIERLYYGTDNKLMTIEDGYAILKQEYDGRGNVIKETYEDVEGKPCLDRNGIAELEINYNEHGDIVSFKKYNMRGDILQIWHNPKIAISR